MIKQFMVWLLVTMALQNSTVFADAATEASMSLPESRSTAKTQGNTGTKPSQTELWLLAQSSGQHITPHPQQSSLEERELANQRLLNSYGHPIPEFFDDEVGGKFEK